MGIRKQRDTSYSMTQRLIKTIGLAEVEKAWQKQGMYAWQELSQKMDEYVSPYVLRYMSNKYNWKRPVNKLSPLYKGYLAGNINPSRFKHIIFPSEEENNEQKL